MECCQKYLYIKKQENSLTTFAFVPARCKSWSCPECRKIKANTVRNYIVDNFTDENLYMLTLTYFHTNDVLACWETQGKKWNKMRTYIAKKYGRFDYLRVVEPHKKGGWPHMHVLIKGCVIDKKIVKMVTKWGFGWNMECQRISTKDASEYISKYLTKEWPNAKADVLRQASKTRIVSVSRGMPAIFRAETEWEVVQHSLPSDRTLFYLNAFIKYLLKKKANYIQAIPYCKGFVIESDIDVDFDAIEMDMDPFIWKYCEADVFIHCPYGWQEKMLL